MSRRLLQKSALPPGQARLVKMTPSSKKDTFDEVAEEARSAFRLATRIADLVNIETKCFYYNQTTAFPIPAIQTVTPDWSSSTPVTLNVIEQGDDDYQRIGDSLKVQHCDIMFTLNPGSLISGFPKLKYRIVVFWDETNSTNAANQVLEAAFFGTNLITAIPKDWDEKASTKILHDRVYETENENTGVANAYQLQQSSGHRISLKIDKHTQYENETNTIVTGALKMFFVTDWPNTNPGLIIWTSRVLFTDD